MLTVWQIVWHEAGDYSSNQFNFQAGTLIGRENEAPADSWKLLDRNNVLIWSTPIETGVWQNFAITLDFEQKYYTLYPQGKTEMTSC